jgi:hypothetical protein
LPVEREIGRVLGDVEQGLVNIERAHDVYGVVVDGQGRVDMDATDELRRKLSVHA